MPSFCQLQKKISFLQLNINWLLGLEGGSPCKCCAFKGVMRLIPCSANKNTWHLNAATSRTSRLVKWVRMLEQWEIVKWKALTCQTWLSCRFPTRWLDSHTVLDPNDQHVVQQDSSRTILECQFKTGLFCLLLMHLRKGRMSHILRFLSLFGSLGQIFWFLTSVWPRLVCWGLWGVNQCMESLCVCVSLSLCHSAYQINNSISLKNPVAIPTRCSMHQQSVAVY